MAHGTNIISQIKLPNGTQYEIHDANALHSIEDLNLATVLTFAGTDTSTNILKKSSAKKGEVWLATDNNVEYVCIETYSGLTDATAIAAKWEKLGNVHNAATTSHTHNVTVTGTNGTSTVTGKVTVPTVSTTTKYIGASASVPTVEDKSVTDNVLGEDTTITVSGGEETKTYVKATASGTAVGANGTAKPITGFGAHSTTPVITELTTKTTSHVTKVETVYPSWEATVTNGVLEIGWSAGSVTPTIGTETIVTGGSTSNAITALGTPTTATVLTGVKVTTQPTITLATDTNSGTGKVQVVTDVSSVSATLNKDIVAAVTDVDVTIEAPAISLSAADTPTTGKVGVVSTATIGSTTANITDGVAAAQKWTQATGTTGAPKN